jgi:DNA-binding NtrC family response regulator
MNGALGPLRIRFLATLMRSYLSGEIKASQAVQSILRSQQISLRLREARREDIPKLRRQLLARVDARTSYFKELVGKPLERILWQILTPENIDGLAKLLEN